MDSSQLTDRNKGSVASNASSTKTLTPGEPPGVQDKCQLVHVIDNIIMANCFTDEPVANDHIHAKLAAKDGGKERQARYELFQI